MYMELEYSSTTVRTVSGLGDAQTTHVLARMHHNDVALSGTQGRFIRDDVDTNTDVSVVACSTTGTSSTPSTPLPGHRS